MFWKYAANLQENNHAEKPFYYDHTSIQSIFNYLKVKEYFLIYMSSDFVGILQNNCFTKYQIDHVVKIFEKYLWMSSILVKVQATACCFTKTWTTLQIFFICFECRCKRPILWNTLQLLLPDITRSLMVEFWLIRKIFNLKKVL